jgi:hypothetical protein
MHSNEANFAHRKLTLQTVFHWKRNGAKGTLAHYMQHVLCSNFHRQHFFVANIALSS